MAQLAINDPTEAEIREYARHLGIDTDDDKDLLAIAKEGLQAARRAPATPQRSLEDLSLGVWVECLQDFLDGRRAQGHAVFDDQGASGNITVTDNDAIPVRAALHSGKLDELGRHLARLLAACLGGGAESGENFRLSLARAFRGHILLKASAGSQVSGRHSQRFTAAATSRALGGNPADSQALQNEQLPEEQQAAFELFKEQRIVELASTGMQGEAAGRMVLREWGGMDGTAQQWWAEKAAELAVPQTEGTSGVEDVSTNASVSTMCSAPDTTTRQRSRKRSHIQASTAPAQDCGAKAPPSGDWLVVQSLEIPRLQKEHGEDDAEAVGDSQDEEEEGDAPLRQTCFRRSSAIQGGASHPDWLTEPAAVAEIALPSLGDEGEVICVPRSLLQTGKLSSPQLESVAYAARRFRALLPSGARAGYFLGDGTGCGKGRVIATLIWHLWNSGARRHLWLSASADLIEDACRDFRDLGAQLPICTLSSWGYGPIRGGKGLTAEGDGILFTNYSTLVASSATGNGPPSPHNSRLQQVIDWLRRGEGGACGLLAFDEAHRVKNVGETMVVEGGEDTQQSRGSGGSRAGICGLELQRLCPGAAVLYASATGATELKHIAYMERLGLWGAGRPHASFDDLRAAIESGGLAAMELLAMTMRAEGMLSCRSLSFRGAGFRLMDVPLEGPLLNTYSSSCLFWQEAFQLLSFVLKAKKREIKRKRLKVGSMTDSSSLTMRHFWGCQQQFFRQLLVCAKVPSVVSMAKSARLRQEAVVIAMWSTGESVTSARVEREGTKNLAGFASAPFEIATRMLDKIIAPKVEDAMGGGDREGMQAAARLSRLCGQLKALDLPPNPLDDLIAQLGGPREVAELSGRRQRPLVAADGSVRIEDRGEGTNLEEQKAFQQGRKCIAVITEAASAGISLHADLGLPEAGQQPRYMIAIELPWEADKAIQQLGRVHRSNQRVPPKFAVVVTNLGGEVRFVSAVARRLRILGAMMRGDRNSAHGAVQSIAPFDIQNRYGKRALGRLFELLRTHNKPEVNFSFMAISGRARARGKQQWTDWKAFCNEAHKELEKVGLRLDSDDAFDESLDASKSLNAFLNRLLMLQPGMQNALFDGVAELYAHLVGADRADGSFDAGLESIDRQGRRRASVSVVQREVLFRDPATGTETTYVRLLVDGRVNWASAEQLLQRHGDHNADGFYWHSGAAGGRGIVLVLKRQLHLQGLVRNEVDDDDDDDPLFDIIRPEGVGGQSQVRPVRRESLRQGHFIKLRNSELQEAERAWSKLHQSAGQERAAEEHVLSGSILNTWASVGSAVHGGTTRHGIKKLPLVRATLSDGGAVVGVRVRPEQLEEVRYALSALQQQASSSVAGREEAKQESASSMKRAKSSSLEAQPQEELTPDVKAETAPLEVLRERIEAFLAAQPGRTAKWQGWAGAHGLLSKEGLVASGAPGMLAVQEAFDDLSRNGKLDVDAVVGTVHLREKQKGAGWYVPPPKKPKAAARGRGRGGRGRNAARP